MVVNVSRHSYGLRKILALLNTSGLILQLSEVTGLPVGGRGGRAIGVKNITAATELWVRYNFEMIAVEVKGMDPKYTWEIMCTYRAANEDTLVIERLAARTLHTRNLTKRSVIGGNLKLPQADWKADVGKASGFKAFANS
jgi:hypothetical protein